MELDEAKEIIRNYLKYSIDYDIEVLGDKVTHSYCECSFGDIKEAFKLLDAQPNFFN